MSKLKIGSLNTGGIANGLKRRKVFRYLKHKNFNVIFLQETHGENKSNQFWINEFGNIGYFANGTSKSRGVGILFHGKFHKKVKDVIRDTNGRYIIINLEINEITYCLVNIYAPNDDNAQFYEEIRAKIRSLEHTLVVIGGDFNDTMNPCLDRNVDRCYYPKQRDLLSKIIQEFDLMDAWRRFFPNERQFTWHKKVRNTMSWSRIDYFLVSSDLHNKVTNCKITPAILTDHSCVEIHVDTGLPNRGKGSWKLNNKLLDDQLFVANMKHELLRIANQYSYMDAVQLWELLKHEAIRYCQDASNAKGMDKQNNKFKLYTILEQVQSRLIDEPANSNLWETKKTVSRELEALAIEDAKSAAFRCKKNWMIYGDKGSKFFFGLEKRHNVNKCMYAVHKNNGELTKDYREILEVQQEFYNGLYSTNPSVSFNLVNKTAAKLTSASIYMLESDITVDELYDAMMTLKPGKTPGLDGLSIEFYRIFWNEIKLLLYRMYCESIKSGKLNPSARRGYINLIPKKSQLEYEVRGYRPLTILGNDYKIIAKLISNRMDCVVHDVIGPQQFGFIRGRSAISSIRRTIEVVTHLKNTQKPGLIAIIDFEKAFDKIEYCAIRGMLKYFNAGDKFINMLFLLFTNFEVCTHNNGHFSRFFQKTRGVNQGCPASPATFIWCGELLAHLI